MYAIALRIAQAIADAHGTPLYRKGIGLPGACFLCYPLMYTTIVHFIRRPTDCHAMCSRSTDVNAVLSRLVNKVRRPMRGSMRRFEFCS
jgi:hypothetical protein